MTPTAVTTQYFERLRSGDVPGAMRLLAPDVVWHQPGAHRFAGEHRGPDGVGALIGGMMAASDGTFALTVTGPAMANGALVAVPVRFSGRRGERSMDMPGVDLLTVADGRIREVHLFSADQEAEDAFWGRD